jgi:hypothetical protein
VRAERSAHDVDSAFVGNEQARDDLEERALAGAVLPTNRMDPACVERTRRSVDGDEIAEALSHGYGAGELVLFHAPFPPVA